MAEFCQRCSIDLMFGPYSDFDHFGKNGGVLEYLPNSFVTVICEGCGITHVNRLGQCAGGCMAGHIPPEDDEVLRSVSRWMARRSGPLGPLLHLRDRYLGTPWEPGYVHFPGHWLWYIVELYRSLREDRPMQRVGDPEEFTVFFPDYDEELNDKDLGPL